MTESSFIELSFIKISYCILGNTPCRLAEVDGRFRCDTLMIEAVSASEALVGFLPL
jgi:hypothetical protein